MARGKQKPGTAPPPGPPPEARQPEARQPEARQPDAGAGGALELPDYLQELLRESAEWQHFGPERVQEWQYFGLPPSHEHDVLGQVVGTDGADGGAVGPSDPSESKDATGAAALPSGAAHDTQPSDAEHGGGEKRPGAAGRPTHPKVGSTEHAGGKRTAWGPEGPPAQPGSPPTVQVAEKMPKHYESDLLWQHPPVMVAASQYRWVANDHGHYHPEPMRSDLAPQTDSASPDDDRKGAYSSPAVGLLQRILGEYYNPAASAANQDTRASYWSGQPARGSYYQPRGPVQHRGYEFPPDLYLDDSLPPARGTYQQPRGPLRHRGLDFRADMYLDDHLPPFVQDDSQLCPVVTSPPLSPRRMLPGGQPSPEMQRLRRRRVSFKTETSPGTPRVQPQTPSGQQRKGRRPARPHAQVADRAAAAAQQLPPSTPRRMLIVDDDGSVHDGYDGLRDLSPLLGCAEGQTAWTPFVQRGFSPRQLPGFADRVVHDLASKLADAPAVRGALQSARAEFIRVPCCSPMPAPSSRASPAPSCPSFAPTRPGSRTSAAAGATYSGTQPWHRGQAEGTPRRPHSVAGAAPGV